MVCHFQKALISDSVASSVIGSFVLHMLIRLSFHSVLQHVISDVNYFSENGGGNQPPKTPPLSFRD